MSAKSITCETTKNTELDRLVLQWGMAEGPLGANILAWSKLGLAWLDLAPATKSASELLGYWSLRSAIRNDTEAESLLCRVWSDPQSVDLHLRGTEFQLRVWQALLRIPLGKTCSYGEVAAALNLRPVAARAVGGAVAANRIGLIVPCHRVLPANGTIGGFRWGPRLKAAMLLREGVTITGLQSRAA